MLHVMTCSCSYRMNHHTGIRPTVAGSIPETYHSLCHGPTEGHVVSIGVASLADNSVTVARNAVGDAQKTKGRIHAG